MILPPDITMGLFQSLFSWNSLSDFAAHVVQVSARLVSILVFVELALGPNPLVYIQLLHYGFNPCFRGTRSRTSMMGRNGPVKMVSILVFVELALGRSRCIASVPFWPVSILVFVELALGLLRPGPARTALNVSILVFVELALGHGQYAKSNPAELPSFNPCFRGTRSRTQSYTKYLTRISCFNPCFRGTRSRTQPIRF